MTSNLLSTNVCPAFQWWHEIISDIYDDSNNNNNPIQPPFKESFRIIYKISPLLSIYISDIKIVKGRYLEKTIDYFSNDNNSLDSIYFKKNCRNNDHDTDIDIDISGIKNINNSELNNKVWDRIAHALNQINFGHIFCNPTKDFPNFIKSLFSIKEQLDPVTRYTNLLSNQKQSFNLKSCLNLIIKLISNYSLNSDPNFIIWELPEALHNNSFIYFSLLLELNEINNSIWTNFSKTPGSLNLFLDHFLPIIGPSNDQSTLLLISVIDIIFRTPEYYEQIKKPKKNANTFWFKLMRIIACSKNIETITTAFCISKSLFLQLSPLLKKQAKLDYLDNLIDASSNGTTNSYREFYKITSDYIKNGTNKCQRSPFCGDIANSNEIVLPYRFNPVHYQVLEFIFNLNMTGFKYMTLCKKLIKQGIKSANDLLYIQRCLLVPKTKKPLLGFRFLLTVATSDKIWSSLATKILYEPIQRFVDLDEIQSLFSQFIKKAFIFVGVSTIKNKYTRRRMMIITTFQSFYRDLEIDWLKSLIIKYYAALVFAKKINHIIPEISLTITTKIEKEKKEEEESKKLKNKKTESAKSNDSIKSSQSVQSFHSIQSEFTSIPSSNSAFELNEIDHQTDRVNSQKNKVRVQYDKNFSTEVDRIAKSQINIKNYLKFSKEFEIKHQFNTNNKFVVKPKNTPKVNQKMTPQQQKIQMEKDKFNDRFQQQRRQMLINYQKQKEKKIQKLNQNPNLIKDNSKNPGVNQLLNQQSRFLHIKATPQSQLNPTKRPQPKKPQAPTLIQPSKRQIQNQQEKKLKKMEMKKNELTEKCQRKEEIQIKNEEETEEEDYEAESINNDEEDEHKFSSDNIYEFDNDNYNFNSYIDDDDDDDDTFNNKEIIEEFYTNKDSPNDSPSSPSSIASISSHGSILVMPKMKKKRH